MGFFYEYVWIYVVNTAQQKGFAGINPRL